MKKIKIKSENFKIIDHIGNSSFKNLKKDQNVMKRYEKNMTKYEKVLK